MNELLVGYAPCQLSKKIRRATTSDPGVGAVMGVRSAAEVVVRATATPEEVMARGGPQRVG